MFPGTNILARIIQLPQLIKDPLDVLVMPLTIEHNIMQGNSEVPNKVEKDCYGGCVYQLFWTALLGGYLSCHACCHRAVPLQLSP